MFGTFLKGRQRGNPDIERVVEMSAQGHLYQNKYLPDYAQLVAEGRVWRAQEASATAAVVALPTTAALFTLGNNEERDGLWYIVLALYAQMAAAPVALDDWGLAVNISQQQSVAGAIDTTLARDIANTSIKSMLGGIGSINPYAGKAILDTGVTLASDDLWFPIGGSTGSTTINSATGASKWVWTNGLLVLAPKSLLATTTIATSTSVTTRKGVVWAEVPRSYLLGS